MVRPSISKIFLSAGSVGEHTAAVMRSVDGSGVDSQGMER